MHLEFTAVNQIKQNWLRKYMTADISVCKASAESVLFISTHPKFQSRRLMCWPPFILMLNENVSYGPAFIHPNKSDILILCICIYAKNEFHCLHFCAVLPESLSAAVCEPRTQGFFSEDADQTTRTALSGLTLPRKHIIL